MKVILFILGSLVIYSSSLLGQTKTIIGKVIGQNFQPVNNFKINILDSFLLPNINASTGEFTIQIPETVINLKLGAAGYDLKYIILDSNCPHLEIMLQNNIYGEVSVEEIDKDRLKMFRMLLNLHREAFNKGIFKEEKPCYKQKFVADSKLKRFQNIIL